MSNTIKDLLRDLIVEVANPKRKLTIDQLVEEYHDRFIKEISKYFELGE